MLIICDDCYLVFVQLIEETIYDVDYFSSFIGTILWFLPPLLGTKQTISKSFKASYKSLNIRLSNKIFKDFNAKLHVY